MSHGKNCNCARCNPESRGNPRLSEDEQTVSYTIRLPESLKAKCKAAGSAEVRRVLEEHLRSI